MLVMSFKIDTSLCIWLPIILFVSSRGGRVDDIKGLERLISIWTERNVYDASFLVKLHKCLGKLILFMRQVAN